MSSDRQPHPFELTTAVQSRLADICEAVGRLETGPQAAGTPQLRRKCRAQAVQASLEIEGNTLSLEQVTAVLDGKQVLGPMREVQEVRNTLSAYEQLADWQPFERDSLCQAHAVMMHGLDDRPGRFRQASVGIQRGEEIIHVAPPADRVPYLVAELLQWVGGAETHPLVASCVFHYEFEFIHPFADGNGRVGRLWQTVLLSHWREVFSRLPVESMVRDRRAEYYAALRRADVGGGATPFLEFMLDVIQATIYEAASSAPPTP